MATIPPVSFPSLRRRPLATRDDARSAHARACRGRDEGGTRRRPALRSLAALALVVVVAVLAPVMTTGLARADDAADARKHAQRASSLAASGKCRQAVAEFDKALAVLRDPALLFNRGECHRKLGDADAAIEDYKQFLADLPKAPNRAEVERRIAELSKKAKPSSGDATPMGVPPAVVEERAVPAPAASSKRGSGEARPGGSTAAGPAASRPAAPPPPARVVEPEPEPPPPHEVDLTAPAPAAASPEAPEGTALSSSETDVRSEPAPEGGIATKPWFWVAVAAVAVGAGVGAYVLLNHDGTKVPSSALGNYQF